VNSSYLETIKSVDGELFNMSYHQERYESVLNFLGTEKKEDLKEYLIRPPFGIYRCRLVYTLDIVTVSYHEYRKREIISL